MNWPHVEFSEEVMREGMQILLGRVAAVLVALVMAGCGTGPDVEVSAPGTTSEGGAATVDGTKTTEPNPSSSGATSPT